MEKAPEYVLVLRLVFVFAFIVGVFGYFWAGDKSAIAVAFVLMSGIAGFLLWKAGKAPKV